MKLILGGSGFIGSNFSTGIKLSSKDVNLLDCEETLHCFQRYQPKVIIHSACKKLSSKLLSDSGADYFDENVKISLNIFKAAVVANVEKIIVISSINAFLEENELLSNDICNQKIKKILSTVYYKQYGLKSNIFYLSNVFGPLFKDSWNGFIPFIIEKCYDAIKNKKDINLIGDKMHKRNFIYVKDVVSMINSHINDNEDIIISTDISYTLGEIVSMVIDIMNFNGNVIWSGEFDKIENKNFNLTDQKLINLHMTSIYDALKETIDWYLLGK